ncbi:MAG TPA: hypothetical protein V6C57_28030, partial [Coleofasciculaceae cyanobacterium]
RSPLTLSKYSNAQEFVIETRHGAYPVEGWIYCTSRSTLEEAQRLVRKNPELRIVDRDGNPINESVGTDRNA